jgi:hypothetical protein
MIDKICFSFWSGNQLSIINVLTLLTFCRLNPTIKVLIYTCELDNAPPDASWVTDEQKYLLSNPLPIDALKCHKNVELRKVSVTSLGIDVSNLQSTFLADIVRIIKANEHGGLWVDLDILFLKPIPDYFWDPTKADVVTTHYENTIALGLLLARRQSPTTQVLAEKLIEILPSFNKLNYQSLGTHFWTSVYRSLESSNTAFTFFNSTLVYPYAWTEIASYFFGKSRRCNDSTVGVHWFNGSPAARHYASLFGYHALGGKYVFGSEFEMQIRALVSQGLLETPSRL